MEPGWHLVEECPEYAAYYEPVETSDGTMYLFHFYVTVWSPSVYKKFARRFSEWRPTFPHVLFCAGDVDDEKYEKFLSRFGFKYLTHVGCTDGNTRRLFVNFGDIADGWIHKGNHEVRRE